MQYGQSMSINDYFHNSLERKSAILLSENETGSSWPRQTCILFCYLWCTQWKWLTPSFFLSIGCLQGLNSSCFSTSPRGKKNHPKINVGQSWARHKEPPLKHITWYWETFSADSLLWPGCNNNNYSCMELFVRCQKSWAVSLETWSCEELHSSMIKLWKPGSRPLNLQQNYPQWNTINGIKLHFSL